MRLATQVQARTQQPTAENWQCGLVLVVAHGAESSSSSVGFASAAIPPYGADALEIPL